MVGEAQRSLGTSPAATADGLGAALVEALDARHVGIAELDPLGRIRWTTPLFVEALAPNEPDLTGRDIRNLWPKNDASFEAAAREADERGLFTWQTSDDHALRRWYL